MGRPRPLRRGISRFPAAFHWRFTSRRSASRRSASKAQQAGQNHQKNPHHQHRRGSPRGAEIVHHQAGPRQGGQHLPFHILGSEKGFRLFPFPVPPGDEAAPVSYTHLDCFKTDFGERIPTDVVYYDGSDPELMHNYYTYLYNKCVFELLEEYKGKNQACLFARSATVGGQKFPVHWGGDCSSNYLSMSESLRGGLSLCMSGFGFWSHDISGFEGTAPADVYKRWAAFGLLSTHSRLHGSSSYRVPWLFGDEAVEVLRKFTNLKCTLMPYLYSAAVETHETGVPSMRAMALEFPEDIPCSDLDRRYMLGGDLLVAPVFSESGDVDYYLPEGTWTNFLTGQAVEGGKWRHEVHGFMSLPLMARENSLIPVGANDQKVEYDYGKGLTLHLFALKEKAFADVKDMYGGDLLKASAVNRDGKVTFTFEGRAEGLKVLLRNIHAMKELAGAGSQDTEQGLLLTVNAGLDPVTFTL